MKPDAGQLKAMLEDRKSHVFSELHAEMDIDENHVNATNQYMNPLIKPYLVGVAEDYPVKVIPIMRWAVQTMSNVIFNGETPKVRFVVDKDVSFPKAKSWDEGVKKLTAFGQGFVHWVDHHGTTESVFNEFGFQTSSLGAGALLYGLDKSLLPKEPAQGATEEEWQQYEIAKRDCVPFDVRSPHPRSLLWDVDTDPYRDVFIVEKISRSKAIDLYPHLFGELNIGESERRDLERVIYYSKEWMYESIDGKACLEGEVVDNPWGRIPVQIALSGLGNNDKDYSMVSRVQGIVRANRDTVLADIIAFNLKERAKTEHGIGGLDFRGDNQDDVSATMRDYRRGPDVKNAITGNTQVAPSPLAAINPDVFRTDEDIRRYEEMGFGPAVQRGALQTDNNSVNSQNLASAHQYYARARAACYQAGAQMIMDIVHMIKNDLADTVYLRQANEDGFVALGPDDIPDHGWRVEFDGAPPSMAERRQNKDSDLADLNSKAIDLETYRDRQGVENGDVIDANNIKRMIAESDAVMQVLTAFAARKTDEQLQVLEKQQRAEDIKAGVMQPPPAPPMPPRGQPQTPPMQGAPNAVPPGVMPDMGGGGMPVGPMGPAGGAVGPVAVPLPAGMGQ